MKIVASSADDSIKQASAIQLKSCINKYWGFYEDTTDYHLSNEDRAFVRNHIFEVKVQSFAIFHSAVWSSSMIPVSGTGGPGFNSRNGPFWKFPYF